MNILKIYIPFYGIKYAKRIIQNGTLDDDSIHFWLSIVWQSFMIDLSIFIIIELVYKIFH